MSQRKIAAALGRSPSTISRELRRNSQPTKAWRGGYDPVRAQKLANRRRQWDGRFKLARQPDLRKRVKNRLAMGCSPQQIAGRLAREDARPVISHESIYRFIYHLAAQKGDWHRMLPRHKAKRGRKARRLGSAASFIKHRRPISERPAEVNDRTTPGHWETDFMLFAKYGQGILVLHERHTRFTIAVQPADRKAALTAQTITQQLQSLPPQMRKTISFDNGTEFAEHYRLHETLAVQTFFCDPHHPWQKGGIENTIGRLRRQLPRKLDLTTLSRRTLARYVERLNNTPRKCLDFRTPAEALSAALANVALQP